MSDSDELHSDYPTLQALTDERFRRPWQNHPSGRGWHYCVSVERYDNPGDSTCLQIVWVGSPSLAADGFMWTPANEVPSLP